MPAAGIGLSKEGKKLFVSVGSKSNVDDNEAEKDRARIFEYDPDGKNGRVFATGIRNPVGLAIHPKTGELWTSVNERDELGDDLVPDYVTRVKEAGFYGWPWFYLGGHSDPRHAGKHPELKENVITPDVLLRSHSASLDSHFTTAGNFQPSIATMLSPPNTAHGIARDVPATKSSASPPSTAKRPANTLIS